jgi:M6 family metalloprotease-like protein
MKQTLEKAFFGTSDDTGWESLQSYYYKSSYGQLNIGGTVLEPFNTGKNISYYNSLQKQYIKDLEDYQNYETDVMPDGVEYEILSAALKHYDSQINYADYDYNNDGLIDSIYLVYTCGYSDDYESLWWAFTQEYLTSDYEYNDNVEADFYCFFSYQFFFDDLFEKKLKLNCETVIHETGHLLGLDDYYDYSEYEGPAGGIGGGDMMDYNVGDHNAYSKMMLGWIDPVVVTGTSTIKLSSFSKSGDAVFIFKNYNNTFFDEYFVIDYFTPDGLNELGKGNNGLFSSSGIRIYHVNSTLNNPSDCYSIYELTLYNNSYTDNKLISLVEADGRNDILDNGYSEDSDLFKVGNVCNNLKWHDNSKVNFIIKVDSISSSSATITIEFED